jgi:hypothetical protein
MGKAPSTNPVDAARAARQAEAACKAKLAQVECEIELERIQRVETELVEEKQRPQRKREAEAAEIKAWRDAEALARKERREAWQAFWERRRKARQERREKEGGQSGTLRVLTGLGLPAVLALVIYAVTQEDDTGEILGVGLLTAIAAFTVGSLLGFLFGIPRSVAAAKKAEKDGDATEAGDAAAVAAEAAERFAPNTNLEEISDWLTKILVGVGLVQIHQISGAVEDLAEGLEGGLGTRGFSVAVALLISFSITGFVSAYLYTRLRLQGAFERALYRDAAAKITAAAEKLTTAADAIGLVQKQLSPGDVDRPSAEELTSALTAATPGARSQAFYTARDQRRKNWRGRSSAGEDKDYVAPTIGVFEALIACDAEGHYHRTRAELGYALKDQKTPDWSAARVALTKAIELRPDTDAVQSGMYEFNRAYCNIKLDLEAGTSSAAPGLVKAIVDDLEAALRSSDGREIVLAAVGSGIRAEKDWEDRTVSTWLEHNKLNPDVGDLLGRSPQ